MVARQSLNKCFYNSVQKEFAYVTIVRDCKIIAISLSFGIHSFIPSTRNTDKAL